MLAGIGQSVRHCHRWWDSWRSGRDKRGCSLAGGQTQESLAEEGLTRISIELLLSLLMNAVLGQMLTHSRMRARTAPMRDFIQDGDVEEAVTESDHLDELAECDAQNRRRVEGGTPTLAMAWVGRVPAGTGLRLKPTGWLLRSQITSRPPSAPASKSARSCPRKGHLLNDARHHRFAAYVGNEDTRGRDRQGNLWVVSCWK